MDFFK
jgi:hypothetical protein